MGKPRALSGPMGTINAERCVACHTAIDTTSKFCGDCAKRLRRAMISLSSYSDDAINTRHNLSKKNKGVKIWVNIQP